MSVSHTVRAGTARLLLVAACMTLMASCSLLPKATPVELHRYTLDWPPAPKAFAAGGPVILVAPVTARTELASQRMAYRRTPHEIAYYSRSQWATPPAEVLGPLVVDALEASGRFQSVVQAGSPAAANIRLDLVLEQLHHDVASDPGAVHLRLRGQLLSLDTGQVLATRQFAYTASAQNNAKSASRAWNSLLGLLLADVAAFSAEGAADSGR